MILFLLGLISPGPNFLVVAQSTLGWGRLAGFVTGLGAATGDALYATCGLFGVEQLIATGGHLMTSIRLLGGLYLVYIGLQMLFGRTGQGHCQDSRSPAHISHFRHFARGLMTDLANPKTIVFFASIFAVTVGPETPRSIRLVMLCAIVLTSIAWRFFLSVVFSTPVIRRAYQRSERSVSRIFGAALCLFGAHLVKQAGS